MYKIYVYGAKEDIETAPEDDEANLASDKKPVKKNSKNPVKRKLE